MEVQGPGELGVRYILVDPVTGSKVTSGDAQAVSPTQYTIQLPAEATAAIRPGLYDLFITAFSDEVSSLAERKITIEATTGELSPVATPTPVQPSEPAPQVTATPRPTSEGRSGRSCSGPPLSIPRQ